MIREVHGFQAICDVCEEPYGTDDIGVLFDSIDLLRQRIEPHGWAVTRDRVRCPDCLAIDQPEGADRG